MKRYAVGRKESDLRNLSVGIILIMFSLSGLAGETYTDFPKKVDPSQKYVFYSHGYIVEGEDEKPVHPKWGMYDFPLVKEKLSDDSYQLIARHRPKNTNPIEYAKSLVNEVNLLLESGVSPENITLIGFSRGGAITILASNELKNSQLNFVILAGCAGLVKNNPNLKLYGRILSIYETSDQVGSCYFMKERSDEVSFTELAISTGKEHGAFYIPRDEWLEPLKQWLWVTP